MTGAWSLQTIWTKGFVGIKASVFLWETMHTLPINLMGRWNPVVLKRISTLSQQAACHAIHLFIPPKSLVAFVDLCEISIAARTAHAPIL